MPPALVMVGLLAATIKVRILLMSRIAQTALVAIPLFAGAVPNARDMVQALPRWFAIASEVEKAKGQIDLATRPLPGKWTSTDGQRFLSAVESLKAEVGQLRDAAQAAAASLAALGALYLALFKVLAAFTTAVVAFLVACAALMPTPAGPAAKAAAEAAGLSVVTTTAAVIKMLVMAGGTVGVVFVQGTVAAVAFKASTYDTGAIGTPDIQEIKISWDRSLAAQPSQPGPAGRPAPSPTTMP